MPFKQFLYLREVIACRSINQAAQNLYISSQALRASIGSTEDKLGFKVFERSNKGVTLTPEGEQIEEDIYEICRTAERWKEIQEGRKNVDGVVRLVAATSVCNTIIPSMMLTCRERYPKLCIQQYEARDVGMLSMLAKKRMLGITGAVPEPEVRTRFVQFAEENNYMIETLRRDNFYIYVNSANPLAQKERLTLEDLRQLTPALYPKEDQRNYFRAIYSHFAPVTPFYLMHQENIFQLAAESPRIACVFPSIAGSANQHVKNGQLRPMEVEDFPMPALCCMIHPRPRELTNSEKAVMDLIRELLKEPVEDV